MNIRDYNPDRLIDTDDDCAELIRTEIDRATRTYMGGFKIEPEYYLDIIVPREWDDATKARGYVADMAVAMQRKMRGDREGDTVGIEQLVLLSRYYPPVSILFPPWTRMDDTLRLIFGGMPWVGPVLAEFGRGGLSFKRACNGGLYLNRPSELRY